MFSNLIYQFPEITELWLSRSVVESLIIHLLMPQIQESVGVLIGTPGHATSAVRLLNSNADLEAFRIESFEIVRASKYALQRGKQIVALYHRHPSGDLKLSNRDQLFLAQSQWAWLVVALAGDELLYRGYAARTCNPLRIVLE